MSRPTKGMEISNQAMGRLFSFGFVLSKILDGCLKPVRVFLEMPDGHVTHVAKQAPDLAGSVAVINGQGSDSVTSAPWMSTDGADTALRVVESIPFLNSHTVLKFKISGLGGVNGESCLLFFKGILGPNAMPKLLGVGARILWATWHVCRKGVEAISHTAVVARLHDPAARPFLNRPIFSRSWVSLAPSMESIEATRLARGVQPVIFIDRLRKVIFRKNLLAFGAKFFRRALLWTLAAFSPGVPKETLGGYGFLAPGACNNSLRLACYTGQVFSPIVCFRLSEYQCMRSDTALSINKRGLFS